MGFISNAISYYRDYGLLNLIHAGSLKLLHTDIVTPILYPIWTWYKTDNNGWISHQGVRIDLSDSTFSHEIKREFLTGYEIDEIRLLERYVSQSDNIIELGGGIGFVSCHIGLNVSVSDQHHVIEANPSLIPVIRKHMMENDCSFKIHHNAYSPCQETVEFHVHENFFSSTTKPEDRAYDETITVEPIDLRKLCTEQSIDRFDLIVDIEGEEYALIDHEVKLLSECCNIMVVEFHEREGSEVDDTIKIMELNEFRLIESKNDVFVFENKRL